MTDCSELIAEWKRMRRRRRKESPTPAPRPAAQSKPAPTAADIFGPKRRNGSSRYHGVVKLSHNGRWRAVLRTGRTYERLGCHATELEAARAVDRRALEVYGVAVNFPEGGEA